MKVVIIEDELTARQNLKVLLHKVEPLVEVIGEGESIREGVALLQKATDAELVFMDIELADGNAFEIFEAVNVTLPVIFTTAYSSFAIKAFEVNSVDYLLKPLTEIQLKKALDKYKAVHNQEKTIDYNALIASFNSTEAPAYKKSFLLEKGDHFVPVKVAEVAFVFIENEIVKCTTFEAKTYTMSESLEHVNKQLDPAMFFRANRQFIVNKEAVTKIGRYFGGKLMLSLHPASAEKVVVSKDKSGVFKSWMMD